MPLQFDRKSCSGAWQYCMPIYNTLLVSSGRRTRLKSATARVRACVSHNNTDGFKDTRPRRLTVISRSGLRQNPGRVAARKRGAGSKARGSAQLRAAEPDCNSACQWKGRATVNKSNAVHTSGDRRILVTGGAAFIRSHLCACRTRAGPSPIRQPVFRAPSP